MRSGARRKHEEASAHFRAAVVDYDAAEKADPTLARLFGKNREYARNHRH